MGGRIMINRSDGHVGQKDPLGVLEEFYTFLRMGFFSPEGDQAIKLRAGVVAVVVAAIGFEDIEVAGHIESTDPGGPCNLVVAIYAGLEEDFPLLVGQGDFDAEFVLPHLLNGFGDGPMALRCVEDQFGRGKAFSVGIACFGQEPAGFIQVRRYLEIRYVSIDGRWDKGAGELLATLGDIFDDLLPVDGVGERAADPGIIEGRFLYIKFVVVGAIEGGDG